MHRRIRGYSLTLAAVWSLASLCVPAAKAQLWTWTKDQMLDYTKAWTGERFPDGRPKVPDQWLDRAKDTSAEEITISSGGRGGGGGGGYSQYEGDFRVLHPDMHMAGRAFTVVFMPNRQDLDSVITAKLRDRGIPALNNQYVIDMLQPGDVLVVDLYGKHEGGTIVGDNLFYYIMTVSYTHLPCAAKAPAAIDPKTTSIPKRIVVIVCIGSLQMPVRGCRVTGNSR